MKPSEYCALLFSVIPDEDNAFKCKMCNKAIKQNKAAGTRNLESHLNSNKHIDQWKPYLEMLRNPGHDKGLQQQRTLDYFVDHEVANVYNWADLMTSFDIPLSWASDKKYLKTSKLNSVDENALKKYFFRVGSIIEGSFGTLCLSNSNFIRLTYFYSFTLYIRQATQEGWK